MTDTHTPTPLTIELNEGTENITITDGSTPIRPDLLEVLFRQRYLKVLYWHVSDTFWDDDENRRIELATLSVIYSNGKTSFRTERTFDLDTIYALVGQGEYAGPASALHTAVNVLIQFGEQTWFIPSYDEAWATAVLESDLSDADLLHGAAQIAEDPSVSLLLDAAGDLAENGPPISTFRTPEAQLLAVAVKIAWDLL